ncbi:hypothetical protein [Pseudomonas sp. GM18]|uniref:hypothetical protein n=1 Tax=Pseudomonas sp. GM18 TaxID=1144324 RepID=UPI0012FC9978|nr:hypothetical protein [Pseudomonas sp. GM18]
MALMRKKLRSFSPQAPLNNAEHQVDRALQPSAQLLAHHCATSCALSQVIVAEKPLRALKISPTT